MFEPESNPKKHVQKYRLVFPLILVILCFSYFYTSFISYPSTKNIATEYLLAISTYETTRASELARSNQICQELLHISMPEHIMKYGGADIRDIKIDVRRNIDGDRRLQSADIKFEYRNESQWLPGHMRLFTRHDIPGFRYLCGSFINY